MSQVHTGWWQRTLSYRIPFISRPLPRQSAADLISASALPPAPKACIEEIIRRTRLWPREQAEVAAEMIAHFADGLESGRSADELVSSFGDVRTAARLIRRSKRRNRPLWWRVQRRALQVLTIFVLVYVAAGVVLTLRHPEPSVDYIAQLNQPLASVPADERMVMTGKTSPPHSPPATRVDALISKSLLVVLLPHLQPLRHSAGLLAADIRLAASEGDAARVVADYRALAGMARHARETRFIVNELVSLKIIEMSDLTVADVNVHAPDSLAACRVELLHAMSAVDAEFVVDVSAEKAFMLDTIQRIYTDDGRGDGMPTADGLEVLQRMTSRVNTYMDSSLFRAVALPANAAPLASRREVTEETKKLYAQAMADAARPLWVTLHNPAKADAHLRTLGSSPLDSMRYAPILKLFPSSHRSSKASYPAADYAELCVTDACPP